MSKKRWTVEDKTVMESLTTSATTADICKKHGLSPNTFYPWREKFLEGGRTALVGSQNTRAARALQKENTTLKTLVGKVTIHLPPPRHATRQATVHNLPRSDWLRGNHIAWKPMPHGSAFDSN